LIVLKWRKVIQGFLLAYLNVADFYITQSESEMNKGYSDIYMEPFLSKFPDLEYSYLIEWVQHKKIALYLI